MTKGLLTSLPRWMVAWFICAGSWVSLRSCIGTSEDWIRRPSTADRRFHRFRGHGLGVRRSTTVPRTVFGAF